ncbi:protein Red-like [Panonychus citri]|uniref:protein Red-like n=1 Tax=Panonychus citri TaxID=50023 RepID=UPI0023076552|nr:protein Red-like [Panonychus citri]
MELEAISNPIAPSHLDTSSSQAESKDAHPLTNEDFRKLLMTPRVGLGSVRGDVHGSVRSGRKMTLVPDNENRKKKKKFYAALKKQEDDVLAELAKKYRDRARERRDGANPDYQNEDPLASMPAYRAVAPDTKAIDAAERRKQLIEESKFLGGDMKHTHLVKGLDYALLHKVKAELEDEDEDEEEELEDKDFDNDNIKDKRISESESREDDWTPRSAMAANIITLLTKEKLPLRNDLFLPGRMAYTLDLEDPFVDDIPTTIIRSKADFPNTDNLSQLSTNNIVINKLIQIISYLRQGGVPKRKKKDKSSTDNLDYGTKSRAEKKKPNFDDSIYGDIGDYVPSFEKKDSHHHESSSSSSSKRKEDKVHRENRVDNRSSYFNKPDSPEMTKEMESAEIKSSLSAAMVAATSVLESRAISRFNSKIEQEAVESYAECYPGAPENDDAILDSDDEVDFTKMDVGSKKATVGRWDFDTQEEYGEYMSKKEALPKAAFQYGVKMADGRKTRRIPTKKDDKAKIDRDLQKINALLFKRKPDHGEGTSNSYNAPTPRIDRDHKRIKHN